MDDRTRRIGLTEALFREVNERVEELAKDFGVYDEPLDLLCECGDGDCVERIRMPVAEYRELRSDATRFAVLPGHVIPDVESIVARREGYDVVEKHTGGAAEIAAETDPRS